MARGARTGNLNALKHGRHTAQMRALRSRVRAQLSVAAELLKDAALPARPRCDFMSPDTRGAAPGSVKKSQREY